MADSVGFDILREDFVNYKFKDGSGNCIAVVRSGMVNEDLLDGTHPQARDLVLIGALSTDPEQGEVLGVPGSPWGHNPGTWIPLTRHS